MTDTPTPIDDHESYSKWLHKHMIKKGRATGQIDSLMESGTGLLMFEVWEAAKDECARELTAAREELAEWRILNGWGGTPEIINDFIKGQQTRIHYAQNLEEELTAVTEQRDRLAEEIRLTIMENLHLADGDKCTLKRLKDAIGFDLENVEVTHRVPKIKAMNTQENIDGTLLKSTDLLAVAEWLTGADTGVSSQYMASVAIAGSVLKSRWGDATPSDAPDLGRCVRLIEKAPTVRSCFPILRQASPVWAAYVDHWDELTTLWHQGDYHITTGRMRDLRSSANSQAQPSKVG